MSAAAAAITGRISAAPTISSARDRVRIRTRLSTITSANAHQPRSARFGDDGVPTIPNASQPS